MEASDYFSKIDSALSYIRQQTAVIPEVGIILGSGLGNFTDRISVTNEISYSDIPFFPTTTVEGHSGKFVFGTFQGKAIVAMSGRFHFYEGYSMKEVTLPVRILKLLGISLLIVSNAAGGINPDYRVGDLMVINDHIDKFPENPLRGPNDDRLGVRFPDMSEPYTLDLVDKAMNMGKSLGLSIHQGVYLGILGPKLETKAEIHYLHTVGADAVGMSTVPEVIVARHMDLKVFAVSAITNLCSPNDNVIFTHDNVVEAAKKAETAMSLLIENILKGN
ncbi:purine-nucleoside phosphorylase [Anditalea andensis]|uniref:Purine nucleoside phosphorylase n=1 Tax=Anditalea andensis TaxID=1048983 RepID=A0A074L3Q6_9BACT|nr:purine-nucleoside phosphorylase [Anditalea andensis]KEO75090.1 purine nucleoside phosphorylase [Anditalea andensis]